MDYISLGKKIRNKRKSLNLTQDKLAETIGISLSFLGHIERGSRKASLETIVKIANALNISTDYLLQDSLTLEKLERPQPDSQAEAFNEIARVIMDNIHYLKRVEPKK